MKEADTLGLACFVSRGSRHGTHTMFLQGLSTLPPSSVSFCIFVFYFTLTTLSPCLHVSILWDLLCAYCVLPNTTTSSSSRQQFVVQQMACSFFPKMAAVKKKKKHKPLYRIKLLSGLLFPPHSQSCAHSYLSLLVTTVKTLHQKGCSVHIHF